jgi:hypothetical protein
MKHGRRKTITVTTPISLKRLRELLKDFVVIVKGKNGEIECNAIDFISFTATAATLIYLYWA